MEEGYDTEAVTVPQVAEYLLHLREVRKLKASSINTNLAAVMSVLRKRNPQVDISVIKDLIKTYRNEDGRMKHRPPEWDLTVVLKHLKSDHYEPLTETTLLRLTIKTAFLVAMGSAARISELNALQADLLRFDVRDGGSVTLGLAPEFICKNQAADEKGRTFSLPSLSSSIDPTDEENRLLCPVRALRIYTEKTRTLRQGRRRLFIPHSQTSVREIDKRQLSVYLRSAVLDANKGAGLDPPAKSNPHEIRAISATIALHSNMAVADIMTCCFWMSACDLGINYGFNCIKNCSDRHCNKPSSECDTETGQCIDGCQVGWTGRDCTSPCQSGTYGDGCTLSCIERNCLVESAVCNHVTGQCVGGCKAGYQGTDCRQACNLGVNYGVNCIKSCSDRQCNQSSSECDTRTGQCIDGCQAGWTEVDCTSPCNLGINYGINCSKSCSGRQCNQPSSECNTKTGQCIDGCQAGWTGVDCTSQCPAGTFGLGCINCTTRHCQGESDCPADGNCSQGCQDGWTRNTCLNECAQGTYGPGCSMACGNCSSDEVCHHVTGSCPSGCSAGWRTEKCNEVCNEDTYGLDCAEKCGNCRDVCDNVDGTCPAGCLDGYNGTKCDVALQDTLKAAPTDIIVPAAGGAAAALVVIVVIIVVVVYCRRKRRERPKNEDSMKSDNPPYVAVEDLARKRGADSSDNVYVNVALEQENQTPEKAAVVASKPKPPIAKKPSRDSDGDQLEEILDEDEAPTSSPYYNIDEEDVIREVAVEDLSATVQKIKSRKGGFEAEYIRLPTGFTATYADSQKEENAGKNKFRGYYPYDQNRVRLSLLPKVPGSDYINASIMHNFNETKTYIGAQAPKKITLGDFWRMIWEQGCGRVVMLTGLVEDSKVKCYQYWPADDELTTDHFRVTLEDTDTRANYTIRTMKVVKIETGESRRVVQYHYTTWPDHGVPDTLALVNFIWMMRRTHTRTDGPLLVHCSAGIGRTGTYIAVDSLLDQAREEGKVDVQGYVSKMRGQRKNMIQTTDQYECVFNCLVEMTKYGNTSLTVDDFTSLYTNRGMDARVGSSGKTFRELAQMMLTENDTGAPIKNRMWVDGNQEFIVRTAPSLRSVSGHLLCESPHPGQKKLLWKLVEENNVNNIIVLDNTQMDLVGGKGSTKTFEEIKLTTEEKTKLTSDLSFAKLLLQKPVQQGKKKLQLLQFHEPVSVESLSDSFLEHSHFKLMTSELSSKTLVHSCTDKKVAVMFCMLGNLMSEVQEDETVDVLHQVRSFSRIFPDITLTQDDVKQLFDFARRCAQLTASTYANM